MFSGPSGLHSRCGGVRKAASAPPGPTPSLPIPRSAPHFEGHHPHEWLPLSTTQAWSFYPTVCPPQEDRPREEAHPGSRSRFGTIWVGNMGVLSTKQ